MSLENMPAANRCHIGFFGCTNAGKSSLVNAITNQQVSLVSDIKGTTTDAVQKTMEILPIGPVVIIDTAGFDDDSELGKLRIEKTNKILSKIDIAILVVDILKGKNKKDKELIEIFKNKNIPYIVAYNKVDLTDKEPVLNENEIVISTKENKNIFELKEKIASIKSSNKTEKTIIKDKLNKNDIVILCIPIDESAPKGRLILPQQLTIREILDKNCICICSQDTELDETIKSLNKKPKLVITDSQVFKKVKDIVPNDILLTSFSILFANYKGELKELVKGAKQISNLVDNDTVLISEGCTHHRQCNDIGSVKFPKWLEDFTGKKLNFEFSSGNDFTNTPEKYKLIIHCGGCMLNEKEMKSRIQIAKNSSIPIVNYGIAISYMNGILKRSLEIFPEILEIL